MLAGRATHNTASRIRKKHTSFAGYKVSDTNIQQRQLKGLLYALLQHGHQSGGQQINVTGIALLRCMQGLWHGARGRGAGPALPSVAPLEGESPSMPCRLLHPGRCFGLTCVRYDRHCFTGARRRRAGPEVPSAVGLEGESSMPCCHLESNISFAVVISKHEGHLSA